MTQHRAFSESKDSTEEAAALRDLVVGDGVDAAVEGVEPPHAHAVLDRIAVDAEAVQLLQGDDPMLRRRKPGQPGIGRGCSTFGGTIPAKLEHARIVPRERARNSMRSLRLCALERP